MLLTHIHKHKSWVPTRVRTHAKQNTIRVQHQKHRVKHVHRQWFILTSLHGNTGASQTQKHNHAQTAGRFTPNALPRSLTTTQRAPAPLPRPPSEGRAAVSPRKRAVGSSGKWSLGAGKAPRKGLWGSSVNKGASEIPLLAWRDIPLPLCRVNSSPARAARSQRCRDSPHLTPGSGHPGPRCAPEASGNCALSSQYARRVRASVSAGQSGSKSP